MGATERGAAPPDQWDPARVQRRSILGGIPHRVIFIHRRIGIERLSRHLRDLEQFARKTDEIVDSKSVRRARPEADVSRDDDGEPRAEVPVAGELIRRRVEQLDEVSLGVGHRLRV